MGEDRRVRRATFAAGHRDTYTHVLLDDCELDYRRLLARSASDVRDVQRRAVPGAVLTIEKLAVCGSV